MFTHERDTPVEITAARTSQPTVEWLDKSDPRAALAAESLVGMGPAVSGVHVQIESMSISSPMIFRGEIYFRSIAIPVEVSSDVQSGRGDFIVEYRIGKGAIRIAAIPFVILAPSLDETRS
jgi:hypothetical protein